MDQLPRLGAINCFLVLADQRHFGRAADRLGISQPALTQQIKRLEEQLGVVLLDRSGRPFSLTAAGRALVADGRRLLTHAAATVENARRAARGERGGLRLALLASCSLGVVGRALRRLQAEYPDVSVELLDDPPDALAGVAGGILDAALLRGPVAYPGVVAELVAEEPLIAVLPAGHPLGANKSVAVDKLSGERFVMFRRSSAPPLYDAVIATCHRAGFAPEVAQEAGEWQTVASLVVSGIGIALVPRSAMEIAHSAVRYVPLREPAGTVSLVLARAGTGAPATTDHLLRLLRVAASAGGS
jgi:DNA-binding transcriptional LysR family regulator